MTIVDPNFNRKKLTNKIESIEKKSNLFKIDMKIPDLISWIEHTTNDVYSIWSETGKLIDVTDSIEDLLGYQASSIKGISLKEVLAENYSDFMNNKLNKYSTDKQVINIKMQHKEGQQVWCKCIISSLFSNLENELYYTCTVKDITEIKTIEEKMIHSEKMTIAGQLAAGVAHEIRNPLTAIKGFLQLLQAGMNRRDEYYKIMIDEVEKMETLTAEMLFISKPITNHQQEASVNEMIQDVSVLLKSQANTKSINIVSQLEVDSYLYCDKSQIKQVLINLIKNAIEAMDEPGTIIVKLKFQNNQTVIDVVDEGVGFPEELIHKLSEPFFTTKQSGTGLGLMITGEILNRHDAKLVIMNNKDKGSTFRLVFDNK